MTGTSESAKERAKRLLKKDPDFYKKIGQKGGMADHSEPRGFAAATPEQRSEWGKKGGSIGRRKKNVETN